MPPGFQVRILSGVYLFEILNRGVGASLGKLSFMKKQLATGRLFLGLIFLVAGLSKVMNYPATLQLMRDAGMRGAGLFLPLAIAIEIGGSIALMAGYRLRSTSLLLAAYLIPVTLIFHRFWSVTGEARQAQTIEFLKNCSIFGGLYLTASYQRMMDSFTSGTVTELRKETFERRRAA